MLAAAAQAMVEIRGEAVTLDECRRRAMILAGEYAEARRAAMGRGVALGELLNSVRATLGRGEWGGFLRRAQINMHTANRAMRLARELGDGAGGIDLDRLEARRRARVEAGAIGAGSPLALRPAAEMTTHEVERAAGLRPAARAEIRPVEIRPPAFLAAAGPRSVTIGTIETPYRMGNCDGVTVSPSVRVSTEAGAGTGTHGAGASGRQLGLIDHVADLVDELHRDLAAHRVGLGEVADRLRRLLGLIESG